MYFLVTFMHYWEHDKIELQDKKWLSHVYVLVL